MSSGSKGNSLYIESDNHRLLIDAGLSARKLTERMQAIDRDPAELDAVLLTHEHSDHVRGIGPLARKYKIPVYSTGGTHHAIRHVAGHLPEWKQIRCGETVEIGDLKIEPYATPHDATESIAFVVRNGTSKLGHATDLGKVTPFVLEKLQSSDALLVESNHDVEMLNSGPYPWPLKQRIKSDAGHLSNEACAEMLASLIHDRLRCVVLMHLSETNNHPEIAQLTARQVLGDSPVEMILAQQDQPTRLIPLP
ncbi:MAG: MBL fold metallo-hydrolase [Nitrospinales bacterium]